MIDKKATSTPQNSKSKMQNQGKEDWVQKQYLVFLVKRKDQETLMCFWSVFRYFLVFGREKTQREKLGIRENFKKMCLLLGLMGAWGYLQPCVRILRRRPLKGHQPQKVSDRVDLDSLGQIFIFNFQKVWNSKIQQSDQKLCLSEVCGVSISASSRFS